MSGTNGYWKTEFAFPEEKWNRKDADFAEQVQAEGFAVQILNKARPDLPIYRTVQGSSILFHLGNDGDLGQTADATVNFVTFNHPRVREMIEWSANKSASDYERKEKS